MKHSVAIASYGGNVQAWLLDLVGCIVGGSDLHDAEAKLPLAIAEHIAWLSSHGEAIDATTDFEIVETMNATGDFCFAAERAPLSADELETLIARAGYARADLISAIELLPDAILDWEPPASAFASFDAWAPDVRSIRGLMRHVLQFEIYYRDGLRDGPAKGISERPTDAGGEHDVTARFLRSLSDADRRVFRPERPGHAESEEWTARKMLRRLISHDRAHAAEIIQRRTWLLLGVPEARA